MCPSCGCLQTKASLPPRQLIEPSSVKLRLFRPGLWLLWLALFFILGVPLLAILLVAFGSLHSGGFSGVPIAMSIAFGVVLLIPALAVALLTDR